MGWRVIYPVVLAIGRPRHGTGAVRGTGDAREGGGEDEVQIVDLGEGVECVECGV